MIKFTHARLFALAIAWFGFSSWATAGFQFTTTPSPGDLLNIKLTDDEVVLNTAALATAGYTFSPTSGPPTTAQIEAPGVLSGSSVVGTGEQLFGIFEITSIVDQTKGKKIVWQPVPGQSLQGAFWGFSATQTGSPPNGADFFTGGAAEIFFSGSATNPFDDSTGPSSVGWAGIASNGVGSAGQSLVLAALGVTGSSSSTLTATLSSTFLSGSPTNFTGTGNTFLNITSDSFLPYEANGLASSASAPSLTGTQDLWFQNDFNNTPGNVSPGWSITSEDPVSARFGTVVPEPSSIVMLGFGALTLAGAAWRRRRSVAA